MRPYYYGTQEYEAESAASGIIIAQNDDELLIATNSHVVADTSDLNVCFSAEADDSRPIWSLRRRSRVWIRTMSWPLSLYSSLIFRRPC
ncbi:MAG: hypothetical protein ACLTSZ_03910 [Lachnospiraceae bacterium]